jgi:Domain of unknown function (DUF4351)
MSPYQDDDFSKAYTTALYQTKGTITTNVKVKSDENLEVDLLFVSNLQNLAWGTEDLGLFDKLMRVHPTIFVEHYSGYLKPRHIDRCGTRIDLYISGEQKEAKKRGADFTEAQKPFTWILATVCSRKILKDYAAMPDEDLGAGVYLLPPGYRRGIVVIRELPKTPETLWLRCLGKGNILTEAFDDIKDLPQTKRERNDIVEVCIKHFRYLTEKLVTGLSEEEANFMKTMQEIDTIYQSEMSRARLEGEVRGRQEGEAIGRQEGEAIGRQEQGITLTFRLLNRKLGAVPGDLQEKIKTLPLESLEALSEDCLDFEQLSDLMSWLTKNED